MKPMMNCSDDSLRLLLREDEQSDDYRDAARHVDSCPHCQQRIGELAAEDDEWHEAHEMLLAGDESGTGTIDRLSAHGRSRRRWQRQPTAWTEAMARQLLSPPSHPEMLGRIGRYEVERLIGTGGMGVVFKAFDSELNRPVAVKLLTPYLAGSGAARKRFAREARAAAAVVHEHVVAIHNVETDGEVPFLVMQYVPGESLQDRLDREGALDVCEILRIGMQTASGLAAAHAQGLVHRDVKPSNVLLEKGVERSLLTDFGLARASDDASLTRTGHHLGTPQYMSPEQARGDAVDARSDLFSLGSVMYAMCTGRPPFRAETSYGVLRRITDAEPRPIREINPNIPEWLERLIQKLLAKSLVDRFQTADEVAELLQQCLAHVQQPTSVSLPVSLAPHARSRRSFFNLTRKGLIAMLGSIGMTLLGMVLWQATEAPDISGQWTSDEWGTVVLEAKGAGEYAGTFTGSGKDKPAPRNDPPVYGPGMGGIGAFGLMGPAVSPKSGSLHLKWSRLERRFNGTWGKGADRSGTMSLRLVDKEIRGGWTTYEDLQLASGTPLLGDLLWTRSRNATSEVAKAPAADLDGEIVPQPVLSHLAIVEKTATFHGMGGDNQECVLRIAKSTRNKQLELTASVKGPFTATVSAHDQLPSDNGKTIKGIVLTVQNATIATTSNIGLSDGGAVPAGVVRFREASEIDRADTVVTIADILCDDGTTIPVSIFLRDKLDRSNARTVVEAYIAAALTDDTQRAALLAKGTPAESHQIESLPKLLNVQHLVVKSVYVDDPAKPTTALATSEAVKLTKKQPDGQRDGFLVLTLTMSEGDWWVTDIDFESEEGAEDELKNFREAHPNAVNAPPLKATLLPGTDSDSHILEKVTGKQNVLEQLHGRWTVQLWSQNNQSALDDKEVEYAFVFDGDRMYQVASTKDGEEDTEAKTLWGRVEIQEGHDPIWFKLANENDSSEKLGLMEIKNGSLRMAFKTNQKGISSVERPKALLAGVDVIYIECRKTTAHLNSNVNSNDARVVPPLATVLPGTDKATGKQLGTVLGKPIHESDLNKNTSTGDNLRRLLLQPLIENYCQKQNLDRAEELQTKIKDQKRRAMARLFVLPAELNRHLFEKHGLDFGDGVDQVSRQAWLKWWEHETSSIDNAKERAREFIVTGVTTVNGNPISGANVQAHVPVKSSGQFQLAQTHSDLARRFVLALGIPSFATPEESTWKLSFTVRNPPRFVADQSPVVMTLHRTKAEGADAISVVGEAALAKNDDALIAGHHVEMNFKLRPAASPMSPAEADASPKTEQPVPQTSEDKSPEETPDANDAQSRTKPDRVPTTQFAIGTVSYSLPFNFPSVESILSHLPVGKDRPINERIQCELVKSQVSNARHYPLVGQAHLVQAHFKSTLSSDAGRDVVYSDTSHLIRTQPE